MGWGERKRQRERGGLLIREGSFKYGGNMVETGLWAAGWEDGPMEVRSQQARKPRRASDIREIRVMNRPLWPLHRGDKSHNTPGHGEQLLF